MSADRRDHPTDAAPIRPDRPTEEEPPTNALSAIDGFLLHPVHRSVHRCRVCVGPEGLALTRRAGPFGHPTHHDQRYDESEAVLIRWRSLRGFSADESYAPEPDWPRLQVLEIDTDYGALTLLAGVAEVSVLFDAVGKWSGHWRLARSPLGVILGGRKRRPTTRVA
jgi:hypothetical protein